MTSHSLWFYWFALFWLILVRYFLIAGGTYFVFYSISGAALRRGRRKIPEWRSIQRDIQLAILSAIIFSLCAAFVVLSYELEVTRLYADPHQYGLWYLGASFVALMLLQDAYFYFMHRLFHHPRLFRWMHHGHHRSGEPTPWTSFAFDPAEAIVQAVFFAMIVFVLPLHFIILIVALITMSMWAVFNHLGFRLFSSSLVGNWLGEWLIGPMHHSVHHRKYTAHYGLYFTFWDKLLGTQEPNYRHPSEPNQANGADAATPTPETE